MSKVTIYHNPKCTTSRNALAMIKEAGIEPEIIEYLKTPLTRETIGGLIDALKVEARELIRKRGKLYDELGLAAENLSEDTLINAIVEHPVLMERPIVVTAQGTAICRPAAKVLDLL